jgi:hypothetical protein
MFKPEISNHSILFCDFTVIEKDLSTTEEAIIVSTSNTDCPLNSFAYLIICKQKFIQLSEKKKN